MNFTGEIRRELLKDVPGNRCCALALLAAFLQTSGSLRTGAEGGFSFTSEHEDVAEYLLKLVSLTFGVSMTLSEAVRDPKHGRSKLTFAYFGEKSAEYAREIAAAKDGLPARECCLLAFVCGCFLGGGSCTLPRDGAKTGYHLEFVFPTREHAEDFCDLFGGLQLFANVVKRGDTHVAYCKSREAIGDFLSLIGAQTAYKKLENVAAAREENNNRNRVENCTGSNADRSATASAAQIFALEKLQRSGAFARLPEPLRETALMRIGHPTLSLNELAELLGVTKGGLNHRLRKLMSIYEGDKQ